LADTATVRYSQWIFVRPVSYHGAMSKETDTAGTLKEKERECQKAGRQLVNWGIFATFVQIFIFILMVLNAVDYRWGFAASVTALTVFLVINHMLSKRSDRLHEECLAMIRA
jgi:hypothetical protein